MWPDDAGGCNRDIRDDVPAFARELWDMLDVMAGSNQAGASSGMLVGHGA